MNRPEPRISARLTFGSLSSTLGYCWVTDALSKKEPKIVIQAHRMGRVRKTGWKPILPKAAHFAIGGLSSTLG